MTSNIDDLKKLTKNDMVSYLYVRDIIRDHNNNQLQDTNNIFSYNTIIYIMLLIIIIVLIILLLKKNK